MKSIIGGGVMGICLMLAAPGARAGIILTNGSFESTGAVYSGALGGIDAATGWINNSGLNIQAASVLAGSEGTNAGGVTGLRYLRLASDNPDPTNTGFIVQDLGTMVAGQIYTFAGDVLGGSSVGLNWGATVELTSDGSLTPASVYATQVLSGFTAGQIGVGALSISFTAGGANAGSELFLWLRAAPSRTNQAIRGGIDNIKLTTTLTPEPGTTALLGSGLASLLFAMRRRR